MKAERTDFRRPVDRANQNLLCGLVLAGGVTALGLVRGFTPGYGAWLLLAVACLVRGYWERTTPYVRVTPAGVAVLHSVLMSPTVIRWTDVAGLDTSDYDNEVLALRDGGRIVIPLEKMEKEDSGLLRACLLNGLSESGGSSEVDRTTVRPLPWMWLRQVESVILLGGLVAYVAFFVF